MATKKINKKPGAKPSVVPLKAITFHVTKTVNNTFEDNFDTLKKFARANGIGAPKKTEVMERMFALMDQSIKKSAKCFLAIPVEKRTA